jgi:hypothetical protein
MPDWLLNIAGNSVVAALLLWRLWMADKRIKELQDQLKEKQDDHENYLKSLLD